MYSGRLKQEESLSEGRVLINWCSIDGRGDEKQAWKSRTRPLRPPLCAVGELDHACFLSFGHSLSPSSRKEDLARAKLGHVMTSGLCCISVSLILSSGEEIFSK